MQERWPVIAGIGSNFNSFHSLCPGACFLLYWLVSNHLEVMGFSEHLSLCNLPKHVYLFGNNKGKIRRTLEKSFLLCTPFVQFSAARAAIMSSMNFFSFCIILYFKTGVDRCTWVCWQVFHVFFILSPTENSIARIFEE